MIDFPKVETMSTITKNLTTLSATYTSAAGNYIINSFGGSDTITTGAGNSTVNILEGNSTISMGAGDNIVNALAGNNTITTGAGSSVITTGDGSNTITTGAGPSTVSTGNGDSTITTGAGTSVVHVLKGNNTITTGAGDSTVITLIGNNTITVGNGNNIIQTQGGNNIVTTSNGNNTITTGNGNDIINAGSGNDVIHSGGGSDIVNAGSGNDVIIYTLAENNNPAFHSTYDGGDGIDTLRLKLTQAEWMSTAVQSDIAKYLKFVVDHTAASGAADETPFTFSAFGLTANGIEKLGVTVDGVSIDPTNHPVMLGNDMITTSEKVASIAVDVLANDSVPDLIKSLTYTNASHGGVTLTAAYSDTGSTPSAKFVYTPTAGFYDHLSLGESASDSFTYTVTDATGDVSTASVNVTITGTNDAPVLGTPATLDHVKANAAFTINMPTLLKGWSDVDDKDTLSVTSLGVDHGTVVNNNNGTITITPTANYSGPEVLSYGVSDGHVTVPTSLAFTVDPVALVGSKVLVTQFPWGQKGDVTAMNTVFGAGNYSLVTNYNFDATSVFNAQNSFVFLEGGANTDTALNNFVNANSAQLLQWVNNGGKLFIESAGWDTSITGLTNTIQFNSSYSTANMSGHLTADGIAAFTHFNNGGTTFTGNWLSHDVVTGSGLTEFMVGNDNGGIILAGVAHGSGYIMYSGLTDIGFNTADAVLANAIAFIYAH